MRDGAGVICQAVLDDGRFGGRADFLLRTVGASDLGDYHYEVVDTKLACELSPDPSRRRTLTAIGI